MFERIRNHRLRPSPAMVVATIALLFAMSGSAVAATRLVNGDKLIKKHSLSGDRLRNATVTGAHIRLDTLGKVPSALRADSAVAADHAAKADSATNASTASDADCVDGTHSLSFYEEVTIASLGLNNEARLDLPNVGQLVVRSLYLAPGQPTSEALAIRFKATATSDARVWAGMTGAFSDAASAWRGTQYPLLYCAPGAENGFQEMFVAVNDGNQEVIMALAGQHSASIHLAWWKLSGHYVVVAQAAIH